jgi:signal transduction histidine kinase/CheY-like chemotaxis protein
MDYEFAEEFFELNAVPIRNADGEVIGAVFFSRNITDRKKIEQELTQARISAEEAMQAKAQFLSNMSHELRTPLNGIIGLTNILMSEDCLPTQTPNLEVLKYSSDHMLVLINDILDYNKIEAGKVILENEDFNLYDTLEKVHTFFAWEAESKGLKFELRACKSLDRNVTGDVTRLRQVLTNLISNAIKFTEKGSVIFAVENVGGVSNKCCSLKFSIEDSGIGIAPNKKLQIFESFGQADPSTIRKFGGSGLGLTISKRLIELMGSNIKLESKEGKGSNFWFDLELDYANENKKDVIKKNFNELKNLAGKHILVVEDNAINMMVVSKMLEKWNAKVSKARDGEEAVAMVFNNHYDLVLMDLQMPIMDGITATRHIRNEKNNVPIVALTASTDDNLKSEVKVVGMNGLLQKPFIPQELHQIFCESMKM